MTEKLNMQTVLRVFFEVWHQTLFKTDVSARYEAGHPVD